MDMCIFISALSVIYSWILCAVLSAPAAQPVTPGRHVRTKRCSCATFLDKECVYFCHLDIIWVNTPERVVSYGLGNAPRAKRAVLDSMATSGGGARCRCLRENDNTCGNFCRPRTEPRFETTADTVIRSAGGHGKHRPAANTGGIKRAQESAGDRASPPALRAAAANARLLLERWGARQRRRVRAS